MVCRGNSSYGSILINCADNEILWLIQNVIKSFNTCDFGQARMTVKQAKGIPLGNLTSQIFANVYLNELDQFIKHRLKVKYYLRYADDFVILDTNRNYLYHYIDLIQFFLKDELKLELHLNKVILRKLSWGIDFCGYVVLPHYRPVRTKTRRRIFKKIQGREVACQSLQSYLGYFSHANSFQVASDLKNLFFLNQT